MYLLNDIIFAHCYKCEEECLLSEREASEKDVVKFSWYFAQMTYVDLNLHLICDVQDDLKPSTDKSPFSKLRTS